MTKRQSERAGEEATIRRARRIATRVQRDAREPAATLQRCERDRLVAGHAELAAAVADMIRCRDEIGGELDRVTRRMTALTAYGQAEKLVAPPAKSVRP